VGEFVVFYDDDQRTHRVAHAESVDPLGGFFEAHVHGAYAHKSLHETRWLPAYVDPRDGKLVHTTKPKPRYDPWRSTDDVCSRPFRLKQGKVPAAVAVCGRHEQPSL
jgi:hypothetical protein